MAQHTQTVEPDEDLDVETFDDEAEEIEAPAEEKAPKPKAAPKQKARGDLPEGYVTPVGLAHLLTEHGHGKEGAEVPPQVVYSYIKNAPKSRPFPNTHTGEGHYVDENGNKVHYTEEGKLNEVVDNIGVRRAAFKAEDGLAWWVEKSKAAQERRENAAKKAQAKATKAKEAPAVVEAEAEEAGDFEEAED